MSRILTPVSIAEHALREIGATYWHETGAEAPKLKIALCGYREHDDLAAHGWRAHRWKARGGYSSQDGENQNAREETIWFSPACADASMPLFGGAA